MSYEVKGVNGEDLRVKAYPLHKYLIRDWSWINIQINKFSLIMHYIPFVVANAITNFNHCAWLKEVYVEHWQEVNSKIVWR